MSDIDVRMVVKVEENPYNTSWGDDIFYIVAKPCKMVYEDGEWLPYGHFWVTEGDPFLEDLEVRAQGHLSSGEIYASGNVVYTKSQVGLYEAEHMVKVLRKIQRGTDKLNRELGYAQDFPAQIARVAKVLGISQFGFRHPTGDLYASGLHYQWWDASMLSQIINHRVKDLREKAGATV